MAIKVSGINAIDNNRQLSVTGVNTLGSVQISSGVITATTGVVTYYGDGQYLDNIVSGVGIQSGGVVIGSGFTTLNFIGAGNTFASNGTTIDISIQGGGGGGVSISTNTTDQAQYIPYATSFGSTTGLGATSLLVYNPNANRLGINTNSPTRTLQVEGEFLVSAGSATTNHIVQKAYTDINGTLSWESTAGQLLSVSNNLTSGSLFNVTNLSGIPYLNVDASGRIDLVSQDTNDVHVGGGVSLGGISLYPATGIVSATAFYGSGENLTDVINQKIEGVKVYDEGSAIGSAYTVSSFDFRGNNITATAVGLGTTALIEVSDTPTYDSLNVTGITTLGSSEISEINATGVITATSFDGSGSNLTNLNASNISSGTIGDAYLPATISSDITGNAATATDATNFTVTANNSTNETVYPVFVDGATGSQGAETDTSLSYNPSTNILTAGTFSGSGASLTSLNASQLSTGTIPGDRGVTAGSATASFVEYNGTTKTAGQFDGGSTDPTNTTRLNYDGNFYATAFYGDGSNLDGIESGIGIDTNTTNQSQYLTYAISTGTTTGLGVTPSNLVYNPSTTSLGIGTNSADAALHVVDDILVSAGAAATLDTRIKAYTNESGSISFEDAVDGSSIFTLQQGDSDILFDVSTSPTNQVFQVGVDSSIIISSGVSTADFKVKAYDDELGAISFEDATDATQYFSITQDLSTILFGVNDANFDTKFVVDASGNVGIQTDTVGASRALDVIGNVVISGDANIAGVGTIGTNSTGNRTVQSGGSASGGSSGDIYYIY